MLLSIRKIMEFIFDRPGGRKILGMIATCYSFVSTGNLIKIRHDNEWIHVHKDGITVYRKIKFNPTPVAYFTQFKDNWCYVYDPAPGDIVLDIGAGVGEETYCFSKLAGPSGKVVSIEAHPETYICLKKRCELNVLDNVIPLNLAVHDSENDVIIEDRNQHISNSIIRGDSGIVVKGTTIDRLTEELNIDIIDFLKINIEGAEDLAMKGCSETIKKTRCISVACHDFIAERDGIDEMRTRDTVYSFLIDNGFQVVTRENDARDYIRYQLNGINSRLYAKSTDS